jgi:hypothetical protein
MQGYVPPHFAGPLYDFLRSRRVTVHEPNRNTLRVHTSFGNYIEFEVSPHMLVHHNRIEVRYWGPKIRMFQHIRSLYLKEGSVGETQAFHKCVDWILHVQERDARLCNSVVSKVTALFHVLRTCNGGTRCINKDVRKQIVTLFQKMLLRNTLVDQCTGHPFPA